MEADITVSLRWEVHLVLALFFLQVITRSSVIIKINSPPFAVKFHFVKPAGNDWLSFTCCRFCKSCY